MVCYPVSCVIQYLELKRKEKVSGLNSFIMKDREFCVVVLDALMGLENWTAFDGEIMRGRPDELAVKSSGFP